MLIAAGLIVFVVYALVREAHQFMDRQLDWLIDWLERALTNDITGRTRAR